MQGALLSLSIDTQELALIAYLVGNFKSLLKDQDNPSSLTQVMASNFYTVYARMSLLLSLP